MRTGVYFVSMMLVMLLSAGAFAEVSAGVKPTKRSQDFPWMSVAAWDRMHAEDVLIAKHDAIDVLFLGDSITAGWDGSLWQQYFAPLRAANFGIGGDHTGNILWRLQHGAIGNLQPRLVVLLAGVNNFGHLNETPEQVARGVTAIVKQVRLAWPESRILLNAVLHFEESAMSSRRAQVKKLNEMLATLGDDKHVYYRDYGDIFLAADGRIPVELMGDFLHPTTKGYELWANAMLPDIRSLLQQ